MQSFSKSGENAGVRKRRAVWAVVTPQLLNYVGFGNSLEGNGYIYNMHSEFNHFPR